MVGEVERPDQEPTGVQQTPEPEQPKGKAGRRALASARRELNEAELASPAVQKLLLDDIDRLEEENTELRGYRSRFHEADKRAAILEQKGRTAVSREIIVLGCITVGGAALGYAPAIWKSPPTGHLCLIFGVVLILCGVAAKAVRP